MDLKSIFPQENEWAIQGIIKHKGYNQGTQSTRYKRAPVRFVGSSKLPVTYARHHEAAGRDDLLAMESLSW